MHRFDYSSTQAYISLLWRWTVRPGTLSASLGSGPETPMGNFEVYMASQQPPVARMREVLSSRQNEQLPWAVAHSSIPQYMCDAYGFNSCHFCRVAVVQRVSLHAARRNPNKTACTRRTNLSTGRKSSHDLKKTEFTGAGCLGMRAAGTSARTAA